MHPEYGKQIGRAFAAVYQLHRDVSRLLTDTSPRLGTNRTIYPYIFKDLGYSVSTPDRWMPYNLSVQTTGGDLPANVAEFVLVYFWDEPPKPQEPHLVLARVTYKRGDNGLPTVEFWDAYSACFEWGEPFPAGVVNRFSLADSERVESVTVTAVPLFDITSVDDVLKHMQAVREPATAPV